MSGRPPAKTVRTHYYSNISGLGNVAVSRHAQHRMDEDGISQAQFEQVLRTPTEIVPDGLHVVWRDGNGIRIVIVTNPHPNRGAVLVKTVFRIKPQAKSRLA